MIKLNMQSTSNYSFETYSYNNNERLGELNDFYSLDKSEFNFPWSSEEWENVGLSDDQHYLAGIYMDKILIGFILFRLILPNELSHLLKILISVKFRGRGLGDELLRYASDELSEKGFMKMYLEVEKDNLSAQRFYLKHGFEIIHCKKKFYSNGQDALMLQRVYSQNNRKYSQKSQ
jgi:[ribosomal protein S18]-alanine N-acetyltransferase